MLRIVKLNVVAPSPGQGQPGQGQPGQGQPGQGQPGQGQPGQGQPGQGQGFESTAATAATTTAATAAATATATAAAAGPGRQKTAKKITGLRRRISSFHVSDQIDLVVGVRFPSQKPIHGLPTMS